MADEDLEQRLQPGHPDASQHPENDAQKSGTIDDKLTFTDLAEIGITAALGMGVGGFTKYDFYNWLSVIGSYAGARGVIDRFKTKPKGYADEVKIGGIMTAILYPLFSGIKTAALAVGTNYGLYGTIAAASLGTALMIPVFGFAYDWMDYGVKKYGLFSYLKNQLLHPIKTAKDVYTNRIKDNYLTTIKKSYLMLPFIVANLTLVPFEYLLPVSSIIRFSYRLLLGSPKKAEKQEHPEPTLGGSPALHPA